MARGQGAEYVFQIFFEGLFKNTNFEILSKPKNFYRLYAENHGIRPDYAILNKENGKIFFIEIKRQHEGRGNAHERACRYFTPGLISALKTESGISNVIPIWLVFCNGITRDEKRTREIRFWFRDCEENYTFWSKLTDTSTIENHFQNYIQPCLL